MSPSGQVQVALLGYPLAVGARATEHYEEVFREFNLLVVSGAVARDSAPARVAALVTRLDQQHARNSELETQRTACLAAGETSHDFTIAISPEAISVAQALDPQLDEADDFCRSGQTLALPPGADIVAFRRWYLRELVGQLDGGRPTRWAAPTDSGGDHP